MDLISIRRTYNNRRNLIFIVCILLICVTLIITTIEVVNNRRAKKLYLSYLEQVQNAENEAKEQERIAEEQKAKKEEKNHLNLQKKEKLIWQIYINQIQKEFF